MGVRSSPGVGLEEGGPMRRYLIVGNQTLAGSHLTAKVRELHEQEPSSFYIVVPATPRIEVEVPAKPPRAQKARTVII